MEIRKLTIIKKKQMDYVLNYDVACTTSWNRDIVFKGDIVFHQNVATMWIFRLR